jgi:preprotein translocase subunit SecA
MIGHLLSSLPYVRAVWNGAHPLIDHIRVQETALRSVSPDELRLTFSRLRAARVANKHQTASLLVPAFAALSESIRRALGFTVFDVQLSAGVAMANGQIAEMQTGEGKTLAAALAAFAGTVLHDSVHVVTPNDYLAERDFRDLAPVYQSVGCSVGLLPENGAAEAKREAYACDITYGTGYEFGFDYLREQLANLARQKAPLGERCRTLLAGTGNTRALNVRRALAIVDEIDSVLIDEASTPLILSELSQPGAATERVYAGALRVAAALTEGAHFVLDPQRRDQVELTELGRRECYRQAEAVSIDRSPVPWSQLVQQALHALHCLHRDVHYAVLHGKVVVVDGATGRLCPDRAWRNGLQQLLEVKEGLELTASRLAAGRVTRQRYFRLYERLCGMTGTAEESAAEFRRVYGLHIATINPRLSSRRIVLPDRIFLSSEARWQAVESEIVRLLPTGRPLLIGCRTIENSECLARRLDSRRITYQLLNGKQNAAEAQIIARGGQRGIVTIATNMAGRGTDIQLGPGVAELGGMHLIGVERNESRRVDRQLIGRVARQGDPGSAQFFLSSSDDLFVRQAPELCRRMSALPHSSGELLPDLSREIRAVQSRAELAARRLRQELAAADQFLSDDLGALLE